MTSEVSLEPFVDTIRAAEFLSVKPRWLLGLARAGKIPAHPLGDGKRRVWRFRLSELVHSISSKVVASDSTSSYGSTRKAVLRSKSESK
jgi:Helix-turn-helix domain